MMHLWRFFIKANPKDLFLKFDPLIGDWRTVTWNYDLDGPTTRRWVVDVQGKTKQQVAWERKKHDEIYFFDDAKLIQRVKLKDKASYLHDLMNLAIHSTLKQGLVLNHEFMVTPVPGATTLDIQNETQALKWIQASFGTLLRALDSFKSDPKLILTAACFIGTVPENGDEVLRVVAFNLDIFFYLRPDFTLHIVIFDDKNLGHGESKTPTYQQIIKVTKPQFYDEITRLVNRIAEVGEIR